MIGLPSITTACCYQGFLFLRTCRADRPSLILTPSSDDVSPLKVSRPAALARTKKRAEAGIPNQLQQAPSVARFMNRPGFRNVGRTAGAGVRQELFGLACNDAGVAEA
jgi:hypothetical protein